MLDMVIMRVRTLVVAVASALGAGFISVSVADI